MILRLHHWGFLALDIYIAHSVNNFADPLEWVPFVFSVVATPVLALGRGDCDTGRGSRRRSKKGR